MKTLQLKERKTNKRALFSNEFLLLKQDILNLYSKIDLLESSLSYGTRTIKTKINENIKFVPISEISHCVADGNYCRILLASGAEYMLSKTLKLVQSKIDHPYFLRIHQSFLININYVKGLDRKGSRKIIMSDDLKLPISRRFDIKTIIHNTL